jgi:hypothetical protein
MQRPKWLSGWGEGKNLLEARLLIDIPDIQVVEASFNKRLLFFAIGTLKKDGSSISLEESDKGNQGELVRVLEWKVYYDSTSLPKSMPIDKAKNLMDGIISASAGSASVYNLNTVYIVSGNRPAKGNTPFLLDYEMARKIEEAKKSKS